MASDHADLQAFAPALQRFSRILALASLVPIVFSGRFGASRRRQPAASAKLASGDGVGGGGVGFCCLFLLVASELCVFWELLAAPNSGKLGFGKFEALFDGVKKGLRQSKTVPGAPDRGVADRVLAVSIVAFSNGDAFESAQVLAMLTVYCIIFVGMSVGSVPSVLHDHHVRRNVMTFIGVVFPLIAFGYFHQNSLRKVCAVLVSEGLLGTAHFALRIAGLLAARRPADGGSSAAQGSPAAFAALQAASLVTDLSTELVKGTYSGSFAAAQKQGIIGMFLLNPMFIGILFPSVVALAWLLFAHLQYNLGALCLTSFLSAATSPAVLAVGLPALQRTLGVSVKVGPALLLELTSVSFLASCFLAVVAGGTQSILVVVLMSQLLTKLFGADVIAEALAWK